MKTDDLIRLMAEDARARPAAAPALAVALAAGMGLAVTLFNVELGLRDGLLQAMQTPRVLVKIAVVLLLSITALVLVSRRAAGCRPCTAVPPSDPPRRDHRRCRGHGIPGAAGGGLARQPDRPQCRRLPCHGRADGRRPTRRLADRAEARRARKPARAGAIAGLAAGALAATLYALHCPDDSPFFVATWYTIAISALTLVGALAGSRICAGRHVLFGQIALHTRDSVTLPRGPWKPRSICP